MSNADPADLYGRRGAVLPAAAELLPRGRAVGVDLWLPDQRATRPGRRSATPSGKASPHGWSRTAAT